MKLFISWSGIRSRAVAEAFNEWLPTVIHAVKPWFSPEIEKGTRWSSEIATQLHNTKFGLICVTAENLNSPWILFEAGALSKALDKSFVCPFLLDIQPVNVQGPLAQFQLTNFDREDIRKLLNAINNSLKSESLDLKILDKQFEKWWPDLEARLSKISKINVNTKFPVRTDREILEEILLLVRSFASTNEHLISKVQQAFPHLSQDELAQMMSKLIKWIADGIGTDKKPARLSVTPDGRLSLELWSQNDEDAVSSQKLLKSKSGKKRTRV